MINFAELMEMLREEFEKEYRQKYLKEGGRRGLEELIDIFIEKGFRDEDIMKNILVVQMKILLKGGRFSISIKTYDLVDVTTVLERGKRIDYYIHNVRWIKREVQGDCIFKYIISLNFVVFYMISM